MVIKGRNCSLEYIINKDWAKNSFPIKNDAIYGIGGLYGNYYALKVIKEMETSDNNPFMVFNGDIHWFDVSRYDFLKIEDSVNTDNYYLMIGNVENELFSNDDTLGCGCNYSELVSDEFVMRSNNIHSLMKNNISKDKILNKIKNRPKTCVLEFNNKRIAITHGDERNLAGWDCSRDNLILKDRQEQILNWMNHNDVDILLTTHTCLPAFLNLDNKFIVNNGAAGMANVKEETFGLVSRVGTKPHSKAIISERIDDIYVELVKVEFPLEKFLKWFDNVWPEGTAANISYRSRIVNGTDLEIDEIVIPNKLT